MKKVKLYSYDVRQTNIKECDTFYILAKDINDVTQQLKNKLNRHAFSAINNITELSDKIRVTDTAQNLINGDVNV